MIADQQHHQGGLVSLAGITMPGAPLQPASPPTPSMTIVDGSAARADVAEVTADCPPAPQRDSARE